MTKTAALTMAYRSYNFLEKWVDYYGNLFGHENLFILSHGRDPEHFRIGKKCNVMGVPRDFTKNFDIVRWAALSDFTAALSGFYDYVICGDCDELIVVDPQCNQSLDEYIAQNDVSQKVPIGLHLLPKMGDEDNSIDWNSPVLQQVDHAIIDARYSKPSIVKKRRDFSPGGHEALGESLEIDRNLILFHLKYLNEERMKLAEDIAKSIRNLIKNDKDELTDIDDWQISSVWRYGEDAERKLLERMTKAPCLDKPDPLLFAQNSIIKHAWTSTDGTQKYLGMLRNPRKIVLPSRFSTSF